MARPLRIEYEGAVYHVTARGNERKDIFSSETDFKKFLEYLREAKRKFNINFHCYVLMSNHYHLIIETPESNLSRVMHYINGSYTTYINVKRKRSGHLFQGRYKSILVDKDNYLLELSRYIHLNPVRAELVEKPEEYRYSSYRLYTSHRKDNLVTSELILSLTGRNSVNERRAYQCFVEAATGKKQDNPSKDIYGGMILGGHRFIKETLRRIKEDYHARDEVSNRRALQAGCEIDEIVSIVSDYFKLPGTDIIKAASSKQRNIAIYLIRKSTGATNREVGKFMGGLTHSAIAKIYRKMILDIEVDRKLRREISQIKMNLDNFKG